MNRLSRPQSVALTTSKSAQKVYERKYYPIIKFCCTRTDLPGETNLSFAGHDRYRDGIVSADGAVNVYSINHQAIMLKPCLTPLFERDMNDSLYSEFESVNILVTDDKELQGLNLRSETMIIMTLNEYEEYKVKYPSHFMKSSYTPLFKCDNKTDTYTIETSQLTGGSTYLINKTKKGWEISMLSSWIS